MTTSITRLSRIGVPTARSHTVYGYSAGIIDEVVLDAQTQIDEIVQISITPSIPVQITQTDTQTLQMSRGL